jgi:cell division protease FtsH
MPSEDRHYHTFAQFKDELAMTLGGYVVEKIIFGDISTGPSSDLKQATRLARDMVTRYGMSEKLGARTFGKHEDLIFLGNEIHEQKDYSDKVAEEIDSEVLALINGAQKSAEDIIASKRDKLEKVVEVLLAKETIEQDEIKEILG